MKMKTQLLRLIAVSFEFCKKSDVIIIILMNKNIQMSNKSAVYKNLCCHHPTRVDDDIGIAYICF